MSTICKFVAVLEDGTRVTMISMEKITDESAIQSIQKRFNQKATLCKQEAKKPTASNGNICS
jgi:hypothetical protein